MTDRAEQMREAARREAIRLAHDGDHSVARAIAALPLPPEAPLPDEWGYETCYPLKACVWWRESTQEWVLEVTGAINDTHFSCRHPQPANTKPEDVPGLPSLYAEDVPLPDDVAGVVDRLREIADLCRTFEATDDENTTKSAADLIERLVARAEKAEAEVARLWEAANRLDPDGGSGFSESYEDGYRAAIEDARATLTTKGDNND